MSAQLPRPVLNKIPGELPKSQTEQHKEDLTKLTKVQLFEIKERQEKLLANKSRIAKLPDKGRRIQDFYDKVLKELSHRDEVERAAELFSDLNIATSGQRKLTNLEWTGKCEAINGETILDSDDEEEIDPLKIIAQSTNVKQKIITHIPPEKSLITEEDLKEIESFKNESQNEVLPAEIVSIDIKQKISAIKPNLEDKLNSNRSSKESSSASLELEPHVLYLFEKGVDQLPQTEKFKPHKTTKSNVHDPEKETLRKPSGKNWEVTAATPPAIQHPGTKILSLQDSVEIQAEYLEKLKKLREQQAEERLKAKTDQLKSLGLVAPVEDPSKLNKFSTKYRELKKSDLSESTESEAEYLDSDEGVRDEEEERGGVSYVVYK